MPGTLVGWIPGPTAAGQLAFSRPFLEVSPMCNRRFLRRWSVDRSTLWAYRILVSHARIPEREKKAIKGLAVQNDLYTFFPAVAWVMGAEWEECLDT